MSQQSVHMYDDDAGVIYLEDGREVLVDRSQFGSVLDALDKLADWAKRQGLIGGQDVVTAFF